MSAEAEILSSLRGRGFSLSTASGDVIIKPFSRLTEEDRRAIVANKPAIIEQLAADAMLRDTLARVAALVEGQPDRIRDRAGVLLAEFRLTIEGLWQDRDSLRACLLDLERNIADAIAGRGYDNERPSAPCPVCAGRCRWCGRIGILKCGACFPEAGARHRPYAQTR